MEYKEMLKKIAEPMVEKIAADIESEEVNQENDIKEKLAAVCSSKKMVKKPEEKKEEEKEEAVNVDDAKEKTAAYFEEGETIKTAAEEVYSEAQLMEDAVIALYNYYNN